MGLSLRAVVQAEDADDDSVEFLGDHDGPGPAAKGSAVRMVILRKLDAEGRAQLGDGPREPDATARTRSFERRPDPSPGQIGNLGDIFGRGAVVGGQLISGEVLARTCANGFVASERALAGWPAWTEPERHLDCARRVPGPAAASPSRVDAMTSFERHALRLR